MRHTFFKLLPILLSSTTLIGLTLDEAICRGVNYSLSLNSAALDIAIKEAEAYQVTRLPNPEFSMDYGDCALMHEHSYEPCLAYGVEQLIELRKKRALRLSVKEAEQEIAAFNFNQKRHLLICAIEEAFYKILELQELYEISTAKLTVEQEMQKALEEKALQGKIALCEKALQQNSASLAALKVKQTELALEEAKAVLAHYFGLDCPDFEKVECELEDLEVPPVCFEEAIFHSAIVNMKDWEREAAYREMLLECTEKIPDFSIRAGIIHEDHFHKSSAFVGFTVPIPIFDRNQGNVAKASFETAKLEVEKKELIRNLVLEAKKRTLSVRASFEELLCYQNVLLKSAYQSCENASENFKAGKIEFLQSLEQQKNCLEIEEQYLKALAAFYQAKLELKKLLGPSIGGV